MKKNMNSADRIIRILIAAAAIGLYYGDVISGTLAIVLLVVSGIFILTSFISFCPIYSALKLSTSKKQS